MFALTQRAVRENLVTGIEMSSDTLIDLERALPPDSFGVAGRAEAARLAVDDRLCTSDTHMWAAGDVARYRAPDGEPVRVQLWVLAERHGQDCRPQLGQRGGWG